MVDPISRASGPFLTRCGDRAPPKLSHLRASCRFCAPRTHPVAPRLCGAPCMGICRSHAWGPSKFIGAWTRRGPRSLHPAAVGRFQRPRLLPNLVEDVRDAPMLGRLSRRELSHGLEVLLD